MIIRDDKIVHVLSYKITCNLCSKQYVGDSSLVKTESKENKLKTSLIEIMRLLFNHPIHEINKLNLLLKTYHQSEQRFLSVY